MCGYKCYYYSRYTAVISLRQIVILLEAAGEWRDGDTAQNYYWILYRRQQLLHLLPDNPNMPRDEKITHAEPQRVLAVGKHYPVVLHGAKCHPVAGSGVRRGGK